MRDEVHAVTDRVQILRPDDWHVHLRDGAVLADVVPHTSATFGRAIVMPNLRPPVRTVAEALSYRARIAAAVPNGHTFEPLMALYLTPQTSPQIVSDAAAEPAVVGMKLYPAGATTNAQAGIADIESIADVLAAMEDVDLPLLVHGESIDPDCDPFDREAEFVARTLTPLVERYPRLRVVFEHVTTVQAVRFVADAPSTVAATITPHHLLYDRRALFAGGLRPHMYCLPVLKRAHHREALLEAACGASGKFFGGTDSAPHERDAKESACGCAGVYNAPLALALYAEAFDSVGALSALEGFVSRNGPAFYRRPVSQDSVVLLRQPTPIPRTYALGSGEVVPLRAGGMLAWSVEPARRS